MEDFGVQELLGSRKREKEWVATGCRAVIECLGEVERTHFYAPSSTDCAANCFLILFQYCQHQVSQSCPLAPRLSITRLTRTWIKLHFP